MPLFASASVFAYWITTACAILLMRRSSNRRIRLLAFAIGLIPLCHSVVLLAEYHIWITDDVGRTAENLELGGSALSLAALYLLSRENRDRKTTDTRLRVAEAFVPPTASEAPSRDSLGIHS